MASFDRKATDRARSEKRQSSTATKGKAKLKPVAKEKYKGRFSDDY